LWFYTKKIDLSFDVSPADWLVSGLRPRSPDPEENLQRVAYLVPDVFESYARILHPVSDRTDGGGGPPFLTWELVASKNGKKIHPEVQFERIDGIYRAPGDHMPWGNNPQEGSLVREHLKALMRVLAQFTPADELCWFGLWEGWGGLSKGSAVHMGRNATQRTVAEAPVQETLYDQYAMAPRIETSIRNYILFSGALSGADAFVETRDNQSMSICGQTTDRG
jgi:hypothetical protein